MDTRVLETNLRKVAEEYKDAVKLEYNEYSDAPVTEADLVKLASHTYSTITDINKCIVEYLKKI